MDWHLVHSVFQQYDICIFILTWPDLSDAWGSLGMQVRSVWSVSSFISMLLRI